MNVEAIVTQKNEQPSQSVQTSSAPSNPAPTPGALTPSPCRVDERARDAQIEALKLLSDWSKWLIAIETASIGLAGWVLTSSNVLFDEPVGRLIAVGTAGAGILAFAISIIFACLLVASLADVIQQIHGIGTLTSGTVSVLSVITGPVQRISRRISRLPSTTTPASTAATSPPSGLPVLQDLFAMADREIRMTINELVHGQYWFFLAGLIFHMIAIASVVIFRTNLSAF